MDVITHDAIEEIQVENLILFIWFKYQRRASLRIGNLNHDMLKPLMQVSQYFLHFLYDTHVYVGFKLHDVPGDAPDLYGLRILVLKRRFTSKVGIVPFLNIFKHLPIFLVFIGKFTAEKALKLFIQL
jgi:hypothetical protein